LESDFLAQLSRKDLRHTGAESRPFVSTDGTGHFIVFKVDIRRRRKRIAFSDLNRFKGPAANAIIFDLLLSIAQLHLPASSFTFASHDLTEILANEELRRNEFPVTRDKIFLAHGGDCPLPRRVSDAVAKYAQACLHR